MASGGKREGAGRPPIPKLESKAKPNRSIRLDDEEYKKVQEFVKNMRKEKNG